MTRTLVVGLDGASWDLIDPWLDDGDLPHVRALRESGTWATQRSCLPPVTFPNWKCYSSSKNPGNLGVFWFERIDLRGERVEIMNGGDFRTAEVWDYLNEAGVEVGVVNMPTMYPPRPIDGYVVCGGPDAVDGEFRSIDSGYTYPADFEEFLERRFDYQVHPDPLISSNDERGDEIEAILELLETRFRVAEYLLDEVGLGFVHVTLFYLNVLQHFFWDDVPTRRAWSLVDEWVGRFAERDDLNLVLMSDHGCGPVDVEFSVNEWLAAEGYLTKRTTVEDVFQRVGLTRETALRVAKRLGIVGLLARTLPESVQQLVPQAAGVKRGRKLEKIVLEETRAVASGQGPVYLNPTFDVESVRQSLIADLEAVSDSDGEPLFDAVYAAEEVYSGEYLDIAPEVVIDQRFGVTVNDGLGGGQVQSTPTKWAAENTKTGIFVAAGPDFDPAGDLGETSILDLAPTLLATHGVDIPTDMEGAILPILSRDTATISQQSPIAIEQGRRGRVTDAEVEDRLTQLGYME